MIRTILLRLFIPTLLFSFAMPIIAQKYYTDIEYPQLHDIKIPKVDQVTLPNGIKLFLLEDHELPLIELSARIRTGSIYEPADKIGLAAITGEVMRTGGTKTKTGDEIDEELERIAAVVETSIGEDAGYARMSVLKKDIDTGLRILADVLMNPEFREEKIELSKVRHRSGIARRNDNVNQIADREFTKLIYGADSPYARVPQYETINNITRDDLIEFHKKYYRPNNVMMGVWGDFDSKTIIKKIENAFKNWKKGELNIPPPQEVNYEFKQTLNLIKKEDVNQTNIMMGHIGGRYDNPDYHALVLTNRILGIGFTSRLFRNVRSRKGLAYSVYGVYTADYDHLGVLYVGCQTKSESTVEAIRAMQEEVERMTVSEVTDEELAVAKESYLNSYVFNFDTKGEIVTRIMTYDYFGYPHDFLQKTKKNIEKVTKADILRVSKKYLKYNAMQILAVGKPDDFDQPLSVLGDVNEIDITIPVPEEPAPEATNASLSEGKRMLAKAIQVLGGVDAFKSINTMQWTGNMTAVTPQGEMEVTVNTVMMMPDKLRANIQTPMGEMSQLLNGDQAWIVSPQGTRPAPEQMREQLQSNLWHNVSYLFANANQEGLTVQYLGEEKVDSLTCAVLNITPKYVKSFKLYLDTKTRMPVKMSFQGMNMMGAPAATEQMYSDYREVGNVKLPFKSVTNQDGEKAQEALASEILINVDVDETLFSVSQ
jgi:zinc protease